MIVIINGSLGVGKTTVADHLYQKFDKSVHLDGDTIADVHPRDIYDDARVDHLYRTIELLIGFHHQYGYHNFVINYVFETPGSLEQLMALLRPLDADIHVFWLTCDKNTQAKRIQGRNRSQIDWELNRFLELQQIQARGAEQGFIGKQIDTTQMTSEETAGVIWKDLFPHTAA